MPDDTEEDSASGISSSTDSAESDGSKKSFHSNSSFDFDSSGWSKDLFVAPVLRKEKEPKGVIALLLEEVEGSKDVFRRFGLCAFVEKSNKDISKLDEALAYFDQSAEESGFEYRMEDGKIMYQISII